MPRAFSFGAADVVDVVRVAAVDDRVAALEQRRERRDRRVDDARPAPSATRHAAAQLRDELRQRRRGDRAFGRQRLEFGRATNAPRTHGRRAAGAAPCSRPCGRRRSFRVASSLPIAHGANACRLAPSDERQSCAPEVGAAVCRHEEHSDDRTSAGRHGRGRLRQIEPWHRDRRAEGAQLIEGDAYHSEANREKMRRGIPLTDADRAGWLDTAGRPNCVRGANTVLTCSALKRAYRDRPAPSCRICGSCSWRSIRHRRGRAWRCATRTSFRLRSSRASSRPLNRRSGSRACCGSMRWRRWRNCKRRSVRGCARAADVNSSRASALAPSGVGGRARPSWPRAALRR